MNTAQGNKTHSITMKWSHLTIIGLVAIGNAQPLTNPYSKWSQAASIQGLVVDLGYGRFGGKQDSSLNAWLGYCGTYSSRLVSSSH